MKKILLVFSILLLLLLVFNVRLIVTSGPSMEPTVQPGDILLVCRPLSSPGVGDTVVIRDADGTQYLKRVAAVAGDTVLAPSDHDGSCPETSIPADEHPGRCSLMHWTDVCCLIQYDYWGSAQVPEGYLFVTGDNHRHSSDSRSESFGLVAQEQICGQIIIKLGSTAS